MSNPNVASFPYAAPSDAVLSVASDNATTTLSADINSSVTSIAVVDVSSFVTPCIIVIDGEIILASGTSSNTFTGCIRGFAETTAASHTSTTSVFGYIVAYQHNQVSAEIQSIGSFLFLSDLGGFKTNQNLLTYSEAFSNVYWSTTSGASVTTSASVLPNGSVGSLLTEGSSSGMNKISATPVGLVAGTTYTFSVYAQYDSIQWLVIGQRLEGPENAWAWFDIENGVVGTVGTGAQAAIVPVPGNWYRCMVVLECTTNSYKAFDICLSTTNGVFEYLGTSTNGTVICGAQVETGGLDGAMSYVVTNGATFSFTGGGDLVLDEGDLS